jgi:hypothetical protein
MARIGGPAARYSKALAGICSGCPWANRQSRSARHVQASASRWDHTGESRVGRLGQVAVGHVPGKDHPDPCRRDLAVLDQPRDGVEKSPGRAAEVERADMGDGEHRIPADRAKPLEVLRIEAVGDRHELAGGLSGIVPDEGVA